MSAADGAVAVDAGRRPPERALMTGLYPVERQSVNSAAARRPGTPPLALSAGYFASPGPTGSGQMRSGHLLPPVE